NPQSMNGWSYVENNPINLVDPTGQNPEAKECKTSSASVYDYIRCVVQAYNIKSPVLANEELGLTIIDILDMAGVSSGTLTLADLGIPTDTIGGTPYCYWGIVPYRGPGYLEGESRVTLLDWEGEEVVYDFPSLERASFQFIGVGVTDSLAGLNRSWYYGSVKGFRSWNKSYSTYVRQFALDADYTGDFSGGGIGLGFELIVGPTSGASYFTSPDDPTISTSTFFVGVGVSLDPMPAIEISGAWLTYYPLAGTYEDYVTLSTDKVKTGKLIWDILIGVSSPSPSGARIVAAAVATKYAGVYEAMRTDLLLAP
ncbi:MAG: hypothetical protein GY808_13320, partial [Gammaproteobacteria bacterium]|nr:hypothetical protein [Gammaproteobacteria bacterium]